MLAGSLAGFVQAEKREIDWGRGGKSACVCERDGGGEEDGVAVREMRVRESRRQRRSKGLDGRIELAKRREEQARERRKGNQKKQKRPKGRRKRRRGAIKQPKRQKKGEKHANKQKGRRRKKKVAKLGKKTWQKTALLSGHVPDSGSPRHGLSKLLRRRKLNTRKDKPNQKSATHKTKWGGKKKITRGPTGI